MYSCIIGILIGLSYDMNFLELKDKLKGFQTFNINDIKKINSNFHSQRLSYWQNKGYIKKITKEFYAALFKNKSMEKRLKIFLRFIRND